MVHGNLLIRCLPPLLIAVAACSGGEQQSLAQRATAPVASATSSDQFPRLQAPWELVGKERSVLLLGDDSKSMGGYDRGAKSELRRLLNAVELQLLVSGIDRFQAATFAEEVGPVSEATGVTGMLNSSLGGLTTCLASPWEVQGNGFRLILTDGVPSAGRAGSPLSKSCSCPGTDPTNVNCVAKAIVGFATRGNGVWVVGVKASFAGMYYPELPPRSPFSPSAPVRRPVYVWLGGPNVEQGRRIVAETLQSLVKQGVTDSVAIEVWPGKWSGIRQGPLTSSSFRIADSKETRRCGESTQPQVLSIQDRSLLLKKARGARQTLITLRVPTQPIIDELPSSIVPLVSVRANDDIQVTGGRSIWLTEDRQGGCFEVLNGTSAEWQARSTTAVLSPMLADWSTEDDAARVNLDRTLLLTELWDTTARLLAAPSNEMRFTLLRAVFQ
jgi:hypothetical protein